MSLIIRPEDPSERRYVDSTWIRSFMSSHDAGPMVKDRAWEGYNETIARLRALPTWRCAVAARASVPDHLIGFIAWEPGGNHKHPGVTRHATNPRWTERTLVTCQHPALFYVYVEQPQRGDGVARALLEHAGIDPRRQFCFQFRTLDMRERVTGTADGLGPRPWRGGRFDPRPYRYLAADAAPTEGATR